jgi:hypothetical protein
MVWILYDFFPNNNNANKYPNKLYIYFREFQKGARSMTIITFSSERCIAFQYTDRWLVNLLKRSGYCMYHQVWHWKFCILVTDCVHIFPIYLTTNSDYFPVQH